MKIKAPLQMETFNDGILSIYSINGEGQYLIIYNNIRFSRRVVGANRYFVAQQASSEITDLVRIPMICGITTYDTVVINGQRYNIKQIQDIVDSSPPTKDLTLKQHGMFPYEKVVEQVIK